MLFPTLAAAWLSCRDAGLVIERLRNFGSTPDAVARRCVLGTSLNAVSHFGAKQSIRCGGPA